MWNDKPAQTRYMPQTSVADGTDINLGSKLEDESVMTTDRQKNMVKFVLGQQHWLSTDALGIPACIQQRWGTGGVPDVCFQVPIIFKRGVLISSSCAKVNVSLWL